MMTKKTVLVSGLLLFILVVAASSHANTDEEVGQKICGIELERLLTLGSLDEDILFQWVGVSADLQENIYVTDAFDYSLKKFDSAGNLKKKAGGKGQGPGEFLAPRLLAASALYLYATDQLIPGIQVFDMELNFVCRIPIKVPITDLNILEDNRIAVAPLAANAPAQICIYDAQGGLAKEFTLGQSRQGLMMDQFSFDFDDQGNFYVAYTFQDRIEKFRSDGQKIWSRTLLGNRRIKQKEISGMVVPTELTYKDVDLDSKGNVYILGGRYSENPSRDVYVLDLDGNRIATFTLPDTSHCIYIDERNHLYSRANSGVTLEKFRLCFLYRYEKKSTP